MPKLPKNKKGKGGWTSAHLFLAAFLFVAIVGNELLKQYLGIDTSCRPGRFQYEILRRMEMILCATQSGTPGYVYLAIVFAFPVIAIGAFLYLYVRKK